MKSISKYLLFLATAAFMFASCEKDIEREPSPAFEGNSSVTFPTSSVNREVDPKEAFEHEITISRVEKDSAYAALTVKLVVVQNTSKVFEVPESVQFAKGAKAASFVVKFPAAQIDSTYTLVLKLDDGVSDPYQIDKPTFTLTINVAKWDDVTDKKAIVFDAIVDTWYGTGAVGWYVPYQRKNNADGSFDIRLLNVYTILPEYDMDKDPSKPYSYPIADKFGLYGGYPYNYPTDVDSKGTYNMVIHIGKDGKCTFDEFDMGMDWGYGMFSARHYDTSIPGEWDKEKQSITFPGGCVASFMANQGGRLTELDQVIFINDSLWQDEHSAIRIAGFEDGFNDAEIEWKPVAGNLHSLVSAIDSELKDIVLQNAVDPNVKEKQGPGSDFYNLFYLPSVYEAGYGLAFYWDSVKGKISLPADPQPMGKKFASKKIFIAPSAENESFVEEIELKGDKVNVFHFFLQVMTKDGGNLGEYEEVFYLGPNEVVWEKSDYVGKFLMSGTSVFGLPDAEMEVEIVEDKSGNLFLLGVDYADSIAVDFDAKSGTIALYPQMLPDYIDEETGDTLDIAFYTLDWTVTPSISEPIVLAYDLSGTISMDANSPALGYVLASQAAGGYIDGYAYLEFVQIKEASKAAPKAKPVVVKNKNSIVKPKAAKKEGLKLQGTLPRHRIRKY